MNNTRIMRPVKRGLPAVAVLFLGAILVACGGGGAGAPSDGIEPTVQISSADTSLTASYELTGVALDNVGVTELQYTLAGGTPQPLSATGNTFSANLTLEAGPNEITVVANDAAENQGSDTITVNYLIPPSGVASSQTIAAHGDSITITGNDFGTSGDVTIAGISVATDSWTDGEIELTIPADAPGGPQTVTVSSLYGDSSFELFIGVAFAPGTLDDLAAEGHPKGTAVLLSEGTYTQVAAAVELDNLSLYGQGSDLTTINTGGVPNTLTLSADANQQLTLADLKLISDAVFVAPSAPGPIAPLGTTGVDHTDSAINVLNELIDASIEHYGSGNHIEAQADSRGSLSLLNLKLEEAAAGGVGFITANLTASAPMVLGSDIHVENVDFDANNSTFGLITSGEITLQSSHVDSVGFVLLSLTGAIDVNDTELSSGAAASPLGLLGIIHSDGLRITDSTVRAYPENLVLAHLSLAMSGGLPFPSIAPLEITGNTFRMLDADPATLPDTGSLTIAGSGGESHISGNTFIVQRDLVFGTLGGSLAVYDNTVTLGHAAIPTSQLRLGSGEFASFVEFNVNIVTWLNEGGLNVSGNFDTSVQGNSFNGFGTGTAVSIVQDSSDVLDATVQNNTFENFENALAIELPGAGAEPFSLTLNGNHFDFPIDAAGKVAVLTDVVEANLDVDGNTWGEETDLATLNGYITEVGTTTAGIMEITSVLTP